MSFSVKLEGFNTKEEADEFLNWYSGQGEQDAAYWFECRVDEGLISTRFMGMNGSAEWNGDVLEATLTMSPA